MAGERPPRRRPTIREVARLAGVSHQTVSRYLKLDTNINAEMQKRIGQAIAQLDYRPNLIARAMRSRKTGRLALLQPPGTAIGSLEIFTGAAAVAHAAGYVIEVVTLDGSADARAERVRELADSGFFEGIVSLTPVPQHAHRPDTTSAPVLVQAHYDEQMRGVGVLADASAAEQMIARLAALGHRRFLHLAGDYAHMSARHRRDVYQATVERLGLQTYGVIDCNWRADLARRAVLDLPAGHGVTAVIAANDVVAAGAVNGAHQRGWSIPGDLSITGWDNNPVAAAMTPPLTTVNVEYERVGRRAVIELLTALGADVEPDPPQPLTTVIWRDSTGPAI